MHGLVTILGLAAIGYGIVVALFWWRQESLLFLPGMPSRAHVADPADVGLGFESLQINTDDGQTLDAWFIPSRDERGVVLFFHGNAGNISHRLESIGIFHGLGLSVLILLMWS